MSINNGSCNITVNIHLEVANSAQLVEVLATLGKTRESQKGLVNFEIVENNPDPLTQQELETAARVFGGSEIHPVSFPCSAPSPDNIAEGVEEHNNGEEKRPIHAIKIGSNDVELDTTGIPWDSRIHSEKRTKTKQGAWRVKKNIELEYIENIIAELKNAMSINPTVTPTVAPYYPATEFTAVPPPPVVDPFGDFIQYVTAGTAANKFTLDAVIRIVNQVGLDSIPTLSARPDLIPQVLEQLRELENA